MPGFLPSLHKTCPTAPITNPNTSTTNESTASAQPPSPAVSSPSSTSQYSQPSYTSNRPSISKSELSDKDQQCNDDDEDEITPSLNARGFSVVSFSIHRGESVTSVNSVDSVDFEDLSLGSSVSTIRFTAPKPTSGIPRVGAPSLVAGHLSSNSGAVVYRILDPKDTERSKGLKNLGVKSVIAEPKKKTRLGLFRLLTTTDNLGAVERQDVYPDGGLKAWMMVFGAMCNTFSTFGYVNSWGIFQAYYQTTLLSNSTPSNIAWIGSIQYSLVFLPGLITGRLFDLGYFHSVFLPCSFILVLATLLVAECHVYWHFLLCQGFAVGLACGGIFGPTAAVIAHWFKKRRGVAMGLVAIGASIGGSILPITAQSLISLVGFKWTMRILGLILMLTLGVSNLTLKRRFPPCKSLPGGLFNLAEFKKSPAYSVYCASAFTTFLGIYTVLTYIDVSAQRVPGVGGTKVAFYLVAIANASSLVGRYVAGVLCDKVGPINVMAPFTAVAGIVTFAWPFARTKSTLVGVAVIYGFCSGSYISLLANPILEFGDASDVGRRVGMFMSILALGALAGPPISGAINRATGGFEAVGFYAGSMALLGVVMMTLARWLALRRWLGRM